MDITIIGDEIFANGDKVATIEASTVSLAEDFKEWVKDKTDTEDLEVEISDLEDQNNELTNKIDDIKEDYDGPLDELDEIKENIKEVISRYVNRH